ncbi:chromo domain protein [Ceratobasidium sp. AG-Ba]|nr:chromo domain protein [Ceratobasidium sp. AG-Ba]
MRSSSEDSGSEVSEDEYEVEYLLGARWDGKTWQYEVHWYGYPSDADTWEPEKNLTDYGSAGLVDRFWKEWPGKRNSRPIVGTEFRAGVDRIIDERRQFLASRPRNKPVKGVDRPKKASHKLVLLGDLEATDEEDDEDILRTSSSEDVPLTKSTRTKSSQAGTSTGAGTKSRSRANGNAGKQPAATQKPVVTQKPSARKPPVSRPSVSHPVAPTPNVPAKKHTYSVPTVKTTKISKDPVVQSRRGRKPMVREDMPAGSISKDFGGIGTKGKQVERAGEVMALGRQGSGSAGPGPPPIPYAGISMRKAGQPSVNHAPSTSAGPGGNRIGSGSPVASPLGMSPTGLQQHQELPELAAIERSIDNLVSGIEATIQSDAPSPPNSLFDDLGDEHEAQEVHMLPDVSHEPSIPEMHMDVDQIDLSNLDMDPPPQAPFLQLDPLPDQQPASNAAMVRPHLDHVIPSPLVQDYALGSPSFHIPPLQPGQWHWTGDLFVTSQESAEPVSQHGEENNKPPLKAIHHRVGEVIIRDPAIPSETETKIFTNTLATYIKGSITMQNTSDLHMLYSEFGAGVFEPTQAGWMIRSDADKGVDLDLWRGLLRKMESTFQGTIVKIYTANGVQMGRHLLLIPCPLVRKFRRLPTFTPIAEHFKSRVEGFAAILCKRLLKADEPDPRPLLAHKLPEHWQQIPPGLYPQLRSVKCLIFPGPESDSEAGQLRTELAKCKAVVLDGFDTKSEAEAIFVHRAWVWQLSGLLGLTHRRKRMFRRFYVYGSGGLWSAAEWDVREIWLIGGMITFTPAALLEDPWVVKKVLNTIQDNPTWHVYIEPQAIGMATLCKPDDEVSFVLERILEEIALSDDFAPCALALTSPPRRGFVEELEWIDMQYARTGRTATDLRKMCEEEVVEAYKKEISELARNKEKEEKVKDKQKGPEARGETWGDGAGWGQSNGGAENSSGGWGGTSDNQSSGWGEDSGGWGDSTANGGTNAATNGWGSPLRDATGRGSPLLPHADVVNPSDVASEKRVHELSDGVIEGLKTMQIQPCFMREIRRFIVIDSKARAKEKESKFSKIEVEVITVEQFAAEYAGIK